VRQTSSAFWQRLQMDGGQMCELIDLEFPSSLAYHWCTSNKRLTYTLSGVPTPYDIFPGSGGGLRETLGLAVSQAQFKIANSGSVLQGMLLSQDFSLAAIKIGVVFIDTPDLGRMATYNGKVGDWGHNRNEISGQGRNIWKSLNVQWPYHTYEEKCNWRFGSAGCGFNTASITIALNSINVGSSTSLAILVASGYVSASYANGRFDFGRLTVTGGVNSGTIRTIMAHTGDFFQLSHTLPNGDLTGMTISVYPGCKKRLLEDCHSTYNNVHDALGWPWIPNETDAF
jgi:hypothetical protein